MNNRCPDSSELLSLALGQISKRRSDVLEVHLANCPHCQQEYTALVQLRSRVRQQSPQLPHGLAERAWRALPERKVLPRWRPLAIGTGTAALAGTLVLTLVPGMLLRPTPAFAQVKQAMDKVDTATWDETMYFTDADGKEKPMSQRECWAQVSTARIAYRDKGSTGRNELMFVDGERMWIISLQKSQWRLLDAWRAKRQFHPASSAAELVRQEILFPRDPAAWQERQNATVPPAYLPAVERQSAWKLERDGDFLRFRMEIVIPNSPSQPQGTETVWVKPDTYRIVRRERVYRTTFPSSKGPRSISSRRVCENYRYDLMPPKGVFTIPVPKPGVPYVFTNMSQMQSFPSRQDTQEVHKVLARAAAAWSRKDVNGFLACWDWKNYPLVRAARTRLKPPLADAEQVRLIQEQWRNTILKGSSTRWEIDKAGATISGSGVYTRASDASPFPPLASRPHGLGINGTVRIIGTRGHVGRGLISAQLQRQPNGEFRLIRFSLSPRYQGQPLKKR